MPGRPGRGDDLFVQVIGRHAFVIALGVELVAMNEHLRQVAAQMPQHTGQRRGARAMHAQDQNGGTANGRLIGHCVRTLARVIGGTAGCSDKRVRIF